MPIPELNNLQLIVCSECKRTIEQLKEEGKTYSEIVEIIREKFKTHWMLTDQGQLQTVVGLSLIAYAMEPEQRKAAIKAFQDLDKIWEDVNDSKQ